MDQESMILSFKTTCTSICNYKPTNGQLFAVLDWAVAKLGTDQLVEYCRVSKYSYYLIEAAKEVNK